MAKPVGKSGVSKRWTNPVVNNRWHSNLVTTILSPVISFNTSTINSITLTITSGSNYTTVIPEISPAYTTSWSSGTNSLTITGNTYTYTNLLPNTIYKTRIKAISSRESVYSNIVNGATPSTLTSVTPPVIFTGASTPTTISISILGGTTNSVTWAVQFRLSGNTSWTTATSVISPGSTSFTLDQSLSANTFYDIKIVVSDLQSLKYESNLLRIKTSLAISPGATVMTSTAAARLLNQATFGATLSTVNSATNKTYDQWFNEQLALPPTLTWPVVLPDCANLINGVYVPAPYAEGYYANPYWVGNSGHLPRNFTEIWAWASVVSPDQLRQRMAYAFSQILVVSRSTCAISSRNDMVSFYYDTLIQNSLGNFRTLLEKITLTPAMGFWLNMWGNEKANPNLGTHADENYGREIKQLFTIGLVMLSETGEVLLENGNPIPTYTQVHVEEISKTLTGWKSKPDYYYNRVYDGNTPTTTVVGPIMLDPDNTTDLTNAWNGVNNHIQFMEPYPDHHDTSIARILGSSGYTTSTQKITGTRNYITDTVVPGIISDTSQLPINGNITGDQYITYKTGQIFVWNGSAWFNSKNIYNILGTITSATTSTFSSLYGNGTVTPNVGDAYTVIDSTGIYTTLWVYLGPTSSYYYGFFNFGTEIGSNANVLYTIIPIRQRKLAQRYILNLVLDTLFNHPNTPPFICKQLIQRLVCSNPSPAYVQRVVQVFKNNGQNVRGDLFAVAKAILTDPEATVPAGGGKLKEPIMRFTHLWRAFNSNDFISPYVDRDVTLHRGFTQSYWWGNLIALYGQEPLNSPSVFNFYRPDYQNYELISNSGNPNIVGPEFQITNEFSVIAGRNSWTNFNYQYKDSTYSSTGKYLHRGIGGANESYNSDGSVNPFPQAYDDPKGDWILGDTSEWEGFANNPATLVDKLNLVFMSGQMPLDMKNALVSYLTSSNFTSTYNPVYNYPQSYNYLAARVVECIDIMFNSAQWSIQI